MNISEPCVLWTKWQNKRQGHGRTEIKGKKWLVHRLVWAQHNGEPPEGKMVLHGCNIPNCYNINHLYLGDRSQNTKDSVKAGTHNMARKTHCPQGHEYDAKNTYFYNKPTGGTYRMCRVCTRIRVLQRNRREVI